MTEPKTAKKTESPTPTDDPKGLYAKLLHAQTNAQAVGKHGENKAQHYSYAKAEDVIAEAQRALHTAGLVGFMRPGEVEKAEITSSGGNGGLMVTLHASLVIVDPETMNDPEFDEKLAGLVIPAIGTGTDYPGDKAIYKAMTGAAKYAYSSALGIPFSDDPEQDNAGSGGERKPGGKEASLAQKRLLTTAFNKAGIAADVKVATVKALAGDPVTSQGAWAILDVIAPLLDEPAKLKNAIDGLIEKAGTAKGADLPGDEMAGVVDIQKVDEPEQGDLIGDDPGPEA